MSSPLVPQPGIMDIALYEGGAAKIAGLDRVIKLSSNENPYGPSPRAIEAAQASLGEMHRYPSTDHAELRQAIAGALGLDASRLICGAGSDEIITFLCQAFAGPGDEVLYPEHGFLMYRISALAAGATPVAAPETARRTDVDALLAACTDRTRLVFVANPNNPTGTMVGMDELTRLADGLPPSALLVLDAAYAEFVDGYDGGAALVEARDNVFMTRTFSKLYGLGGLRIGYGYGSKAVIDVLNRVRGPFNLSQTQLAAATAAIADTDYADHCRTKNTQWRDWLAQALVNVGVPSDPSFGNFILARFADAAEAEACDQRLQASGLIVRRVGAYGLPNCLRITIGDEEACRMVASVIADFKAVAT